MIEEQNETLEFLHKVAERFDYVLNPNERALGLIIGYMSDNKAKYGKRYCPCKQHYPVDMEADPICPCPSFKDEIAANGHCECHVFWDPDAAEKARHATGLLATITCPG